MCDRDGAEAEAARMEEWAAFWQDCLYWTLVTLAFFGGLAALWFSSIGRWSLLRALAVVNCQRAPSADSLRAPSHAATRNLRVSERPDPAS